MKKPKKRKRKYPETGEGWVQKIEKRCNAKLRAVIVSKETWYAWAADRGMGDILRMGFVQMDIDGIPIFWLGADAGPADGKFAFVIEAKGKVR